jgi:excisionase family DNA binding protein
MLTLSPSTTVVSEPEAELANTSGRILSHLLRDSTSEISAASVLRLVVQRSDGEQAEVAVPESAFALLTTALRQMGQGRGVAIVATDSEMTTQEAANFLHVSRPYFVKLLNSGKIPYRKVGVRRRVLLKDVLRYRTETNMAASNALDEMTAEAQRLGLYP